MPGGGQTGGDQSGGGQPGGQESGSSSGSGAPGGQADSGSGTPGGSSPSGDGGNASVPGAGGAGQSGGSADEGWESGVPGGQGDEDGWETSNQLPSSSSGAGGGDIPPMPSERDKPSGDGELDGALEDFDGEILSEREVIRQRSNETAGSGGSSLPEASAGGSSGSSGSADMPSGGTADMPTAGSGGVPSNRNAPPAPGPAATAGVPDDIPAAKDDDIIARQLREAAQQETDPELKEKLWDEYRKYKGI